MNSSLGNITLSAGINIDQDWLWVIFALVFFAFFIMSLILIYHWHKYGRRNRGVFIAEAVYFLGSIFFLLGAISSIILYSGI